MRTIYVLDGYISRTSKMIMIIANGKLSELISAAPSDRPTGGARLLSRDGLGVRATHCRLGGPADLPQRVTSFAHGSHPQPPAVFASGRHR